MARVLEGDYRTDVLYRSKPSESDSTLEKLINLCAKCRDIIRGIPGMEESRGLTLLNRFLSEQTEVEPGSGKLKIKDSKSIPTDSLQSAYDEDATSRKKGGKGQRGYTLEIAESCSKENPFQLITDYAVEKNIKSDVDIIKERLPEIKENTGCKDLYADGGFHSDEVVTVARDNEVDLHFTNINGTQPYKKLPVTEYDIDEKTEVITRCPRGIKPDHAGVSKNQTVAYFPLKHCIQCEMRNMCHGKVQN